MVTKAETVVETITMEDGRVVEFAGKRKLLKASSVTPEGKVVVQLDYRNGQTRNFTIPDAMLQKFAAHGAEQKLGDEIAGLDDVEDCVMATDELIDRLYNGEWGVKREANGMAGTSVLARALCELYGKTREQVKAFLVGKSQAEKVALRNNAKVKPIIDKIELEKLSKKSSVDTDGLLTELE